MRYLVLQYGQENDRMALRELTDLPNVDTIIWHKEYSSLLKRGLRKLHTDKRVNKWFDLPARDIWHRDVFEAVGHTDCLIILAYCLMEIDEVFLAKVRKINPRIKIVLLLWDSLATHSIMMETTRPKILGYKWDMVLSFDKQDCEAHGFVWLGMHYYSRQELNIDDTINRDICFVGAATAGRRELLDDICGYVSKLGAKCDFTLVTPAEKNFRIKRLFVNEGDYYSKEGVCLTKKNISYKDILKKTIQSNCILELVQPGQKSQTLRYFEAVIYNKKLLTNNQYIKELPFYNERYMHIFSDVEDIDASWLKKREIIDYQYKDEFSPVYIIRLIEDNMNL